MYSTISSVIWFWLALPGLAGISSAKTVFALTEMPELLLSLKNSDSFFVWAFPKSFFKDICSFESLEKLII